ncbi:CrcB family protein [Cryobacterium adonitolivorans]|uniref:Fluoride-specific ion channel FluC n=1 Tax=Cryobacterium adonitolivorans TaxID=1259189 RepID=A0A4R8W244_9MICO|nr:CrcB family protein [Cryobacterium adonitolivorans]TFB98705.1 CrcB family protein [Cryobacterium adonitolivorans]
MAVPNDRSRPVHLRWHHLALVFAGGTVGTALRELLAISVPPVAGVTVSIAAINIVGAFLLGLLLETLARRGPDEGRRRQLRLLLGTGVLGGFTTYSALATDTSLLLADSRLGTALLYALGTVLVGAAASWAGIGASGALHRRRPDHREAVAR